MEEIRFDRELDVRGLSCPLPILNTRKTVETLQPGEILKIVTSDQGSASDFQAFVRHAGLALLAWHERNGECQFFIQKP